MTDEQSFDIREWQVILHHVDLTGAGNTAPEVIDRPSQKSTIWKRNDFR